MRYFHTLSLLLFSLLFACGQPSAENCTAAGDEDEDGAADCQDSDCSLFLPCIAESCVNNFDDNGNGFADCDDPACEQEPACSNDAPQAVNDEVATTRNNAIAISFADLLANDIDPDEDTLTVTEVQEVQNGTAELLTDSVLFTPTLDFVGTASFVYSITDSFRSSSAVVTIVVSSGELIALNLEVSTNEDAQKVFVLDTNLSSDDNVLFTLLSTPPNGLANLSGKTITYTPDPNFTGEDTFTFQAQQGGQLSNVAAVTVLVLPVNDAPVALAQSITTVEETPVSITLEGQDTEDDVLSASIVAQPQKGVLSGTLPTLTYTPNLNATGADSFTFRVNDGQANSANATVSINITAVNDTPVAIAQNIQIDEDKNKTITLAATDPDSNALVLSVVTDPANGNLSGNAPNVTYTPNPNFVGTDSFTFRASDGNTLSATATVTITVAPLNDVPVALAQTVAVTEETAKLITLTGSDIENSPLLFSILTQPQKGVLIGTAPNVIYAPNVNAIGTDSFTFRVNDGLINSPAATVSINISNVNDAPVANPSTVVTNEDTSINITKTAMLANDTDIDGNTLQVVEVSGATNGTVVLGANQATFVPALNFVGEASFEYTISDGLLFASSQVLLTVVAVNDAPSANNDTATAFKNTTLLLPTETLLQNDVDVEGASLSIVSVQTAVNGTVSLVGSLVSFLPNNNFKGTASFVYTATDGALTDTATVTLSVVDGPVCGNGLLETEEQCDDGNVVAGDGCNSFCKTEACGDGIVNNQVAGLSPEVCDDGNATEGDGCDSNCTLSQCGNNILAPGEFCYPSENTVGLQSVPRSIVTADLNRDNRTDFVLGSTQSLVLPPQPVTEVFFGNGDGSFPTRQPLLASQEAAVLRVADFNSDQNQDILAVNDNTNQIAIYLGGSDGTFQNQIVTTTGTRPLDAALADFNRDNKLDVAVANAGSNNLSILLGANNGSFTVGTAVAVQGSPSKILSEDINKDGKADLVTLHPGINAVNLFLGNGLGGFSLPLVLTTDSNPTDILLLDANQDGILDLVVSSTFGSSLGVFLGNGNGTFQAEQRTALGAAPIQVFKTDLNRDGRSDVLMTHFDSVGVLLGQANGSFSSEVLLVTGLIRASYAIGDANGDNLLDLFALDDNDANVLVLLGTESLQFQRPQRLRATPKPVAAKAFDLDKNGTQELLVLLEDSNEVEIFLADTLGNYANSIVLDVFVPPSAIDIGDINNDGNLDLLVASASNSIFITFLGDGNLAFTLQNVFSNPQVVSPVAVALADVDKDGDLDLASVNNTSANLALFLNNNAVFQVPQVLSAGSSPQALAIGDVDGNNTLDVVVAATLSNQLLTFRGNGNGTLQAPVVSNIGSAPRSLAAADLNGDGDLDVVATDELGNQLSVCFGLGDGSFPIVQPTFVTTPHSVVVEDFDNNDILDVAVLDTLAGRIQIFENDGTGIVSLLEDLSSVGGARVLITADPNNDGLLDFVSVSPSGNLLEILFATP